MLTTTYSGVQSAFIEGTKYVHFSDLTASGTGTLEFVSTWGIVNGFSLVAVPEPSIFALAGIAGAGGLVAFLRRRRSN